jgi:hypothetical protein
MGQDPLRSDDHYLGRSKAASLSTDCMLACVGHCPELICDIGITHFPDDKNEAQSLNAYLA